MKKFNVCRAAWILFLALVAVLALALCTGAEEPGAHTWDYETGFCIECGAYQEAPVDDDGVYEISNAGQLYYVADLMRTNGNTKLSAKLMCNITVNANLLDADGQPRAAALLWEPIGTDTAPAKNVSLNGQGYYISGLYASYEDGRDVGLFGYCSGGEAHGIRVFDLGIIDSYFYSDTGFVGGIVAYGENNTQLTRCYVDATLGSPYGNVGGIAGALDNMTSPSSAVYCYTTYSKIVCDLSGGFFANCYYLSDSAQDDGADGTEYFKSDLKLADNSLLLDALSTGEKSWVISCRTGMPVLLADHVYEYPCVPECKVCNDTNRADQAPHTYDYECDDICNVCNRKHPTKGVHVRYTSCSAYCRYCGKDIGKLTEHQYSNACDSTCDCGFERSDAPHVYDSPCDARCDICLEPRTSVPHQYDNGCDRVCNACGVTRPPVHTYDNDCDGECNVCSEKRTVAHVFGEYAVTKEATALHNGEQERTCTVCGLKETAVIARIGVATWVIVLSGIGAGLVLSVGGFALYWFVIKKRSFADFFGKK